MKLIISNVSGVPIYEQIKQQIKAAILSGELQAEETLPSLRTLIIPINGVQEMFGRKVIVLVKPMPVTVKSPNK